MQNTVVNTAKPKTAIHVVAAIIRDPQDQNKIFITQRKAGQHLQFCWEFPGGKLEKGELRIDGLQRELKEEVGIEIESATPYMTVTHQYDDKEVFLDVWNVEKYSGLIHGKEGQKVNWVAIGELDRYTFPEADRPIIYTLQRSQA